MTDLTPYIQALAGLTRRPTEKVGNDTVRAWITHARFIDVTAEADGAVSAFGVAK